MFVLTFTNADDHPIIFSFANYYMPLVEIKDLKSLTENKTYYDQQVKNKQEKLVEKIERKLLDFLYHIKYIINSSAKIYQDKQKQIFLTKLILHGN